MSGWLALHGGGEFQRGSEIGDRRLIVAAGGADARVIIVPTAAGIDYPDMAARNGINWFRQLGARPDAAMAIDVQSANNPQVVAKIESATLIYLPGGDPLFLVNTLRGSKAWTAIVAAHERGVALDGASAGAMAFGSKMWNPHTGEKTPADVTHVNNHGSPVTRLHLKLAPVSSVFVIAPGSNRGATP